MNVQKASEWNKLRKVNKLKLATSFRTVSVAFPRIAEISYSEL